MSHVELLVTIFVLVSWGFWRVSKSSNPSKQFISLRSTLYSYIVLSIFLGPGIFLWGSSRHPSGLDCTDGSWSWGGATTPLAERDRIYREAADAMNLGASIAIVIGISLGLLVLYYAIKSSNKFKAISAITLLTFILLGYWTVILLGSKLFNCTVGLNV